VELQRRVSRLVGSLKESTLEKLLEMGGDKLKAEVFFSMRRRESLSRL